MSALAELFAPRLAVHVEDAIAPRLAAFARGALALDRFALYRFIDRGRYAFVDEPELPALTDALVAFARAQTDLPLAVVSSRAVRLEAGGYLLTHHDARHDEPLVELIADLGEAAVPDAAVHYRDAGRPFFVAPSAPLSIALVARSAATAANHTYLSKRYDGPPITRLVLRLR